MCTVHADVGPRLLSALLGEGCLYRACRCGSQCIAMRGVCAWCLQMWVLGYQMKNKNITVYTEHTKQSC